MSAHLNDPARQRAKTVNINANDPLIDWLIDL